MKKEFERILPLNPELEKAVLYALSTGRLDPKTVRPEELSKLGRIIHKTISKLSTGTPLKEKAILAAATELYHADKHECKEYLKEIADSEIPEIQGILQTLSRKRIINQLVNEASDQVATGEYSLLAIKSILDKQPSGRSTLTPLSEEMGEDNAPPEGIPLPCLPRLTQTTGGVYGVWLIQGEPAAGKSTLALQIAMSVGRRRPVLYYDFEQGKGVMRWHINEALEGDKKKIHEATHQLYIRHSISTLEADLDMIGKPSLVVVDSIQKVSSAVMYRTQSIGSWVHKLEALKQYGHHVILVSEKRRGTYGEAALDGGNETGELEYAADTAFDLLLPNEEDGSRTSIHITKNRHHKKKGYLGDYERVNSWWFKELGQRKEID